MAMTTREFVESLSSFSILSSADVSTLRESLTEEQLAAEAEHIARELIKQGKLTKFQALSVIQGRAKGLVFGEYVVLDKIGSGGMGHVFKAQHRRMKRLAAIKVLQPQLMASARTVQRFYQEVEVAAKLQHANIVAAYDAGEAHGMHFLVMEYVDGTDLAAYVKKHGPLAVDQGVNCILQAARGLEYAHAQQIVHRDIKPSNLLVNRLSVVKVLDMGLARVQNIAGTERGEQEGLTECGEIMGTVDYMAPEQAQDTRAADHRADIYSLGCTLYRLLTGNVPYPADTNVKKILAHLEQPIPSLRAARPEVSEALEQVYRRMMAKRPDERIQTMSEVVRGLEQILSGKSDEESSLSVLDESVEANELQSFMQAMKSGKQAGSSAAGKSSISGRTKSESKTTAKSSTAVEKAVPGEKTTAKRWPLLVVAGVAAVLLVGLGAWWLMRGSEKDKIAQAKRSDHVSKPSVVPTSVVKSDTAKAATNAMTPTTKGAPAAAVAAAPPDPVISGPAVNALQFDGVDDLVEIPSLTFSGEPITLEAWLIPGSAGGIAIGVYDRMHHVSLWSNNGLYGCTATNPPTTWSASIRQQLPSDRMTHLAGTFSGDKVDYFINGQRVAQRTTPSDPESGDFAPRTYFGGAPGLPFWSGRIAQARVSRGARYDGAEFTPPVRFESDKDTLALYQFDEGSGNVLNDSSGNKHHGKIVGAKWTKVAAPVVVPRMPAIATTTPAPTPTIPTAPPLPAEGIDLLETLDLKRDVGDGTWKRDGSALVAAIEAGKLGRLQFAHAPPTEYDLHVDAEILNPSGGGLVVGLVVGQSQVGFVASTLQKGTGLSNVQGKRHYMPENPTRLREPLGFGVGLPMSLIVKVRPTSIAVTLNDRTIVDWKGDPAKDLSVELSGPDKTKLFLLAYGNVRFSRYELLPPGGSPRPRKPPPPTTRPGVRVDLLRMVDLKRDAVEGTWTADGLTLVSPPKYPTIGRLQFPYTPPTEYDLRLVMEVIDGGHVAPGLVVGSSRVAFFMNYSGGNVAGLDLVSGMQAQANVTKCSLASPSGRPVEVICRVRPTGIVITVDGRMQIDWRGSPQDLSIDGKKAGPDRTRLCLYTAGSVRFSKYEVLPLGGERAPLPATTAIADARAKIPELIPPLPKNATAVQVASQAALLRQQAALADDDALRYALLQETIKLAINVDDLELVLEPCEDLGRCFQVDVISELNAAINEIAAHNRSPAERKELAMKFLEAAERWAGVERYDVASLLVKSGAAIIAKLTDNELKKEARNRELEIAEGQKLFAALEPARQMLADKPTDPEANLSVGQYLAIARNDWKLALEHLSKSGDPAVAPAAQLDLQAASDPARTAELGSAWLDAAEKTSIPGKAVYLERARLLLVRGAVNLKPADVTKLQNRFKKINGEVQRLVGTAFVNRHPLRATSFNGHWYQFALKEPGGSWYSVRQRCLDAGGDLVCLETAAETQWVYQFALTQFGKPDSFAFWIGATEEGRLGTHTWVNGAPLTFTDWAGTPNPKTVGFPFASRQGPASPQFKWGKSVANEPNVHAYVCEWDR